MFSFFIYLVMAETTENFENKRFNPFLNQGKILLDNNSDPDENFFDENSFSKIDAQYFSLAFQFYILIFGV